MNPNAIAILACLRAAGSSGSDVARKAGVSQAHASRVIHSKSRNQLVEDTISLTTGLSLHELWPDWYELGGAARKQKRLTPAERRARSLELLNRFAASRQAA